MSRAPVANAQPTKAGKMFKVKRNKGWSEHQRRRQQESDDEWDAYKKGKLDLDEE